MPVKYVSQKTTVSLNCLRSLKTELYPTPATASCWCSKVQFIRILQDILIDVEGNNMAMADFFSLGKEFKRTL